MTFIMSDDSVLSSIGNQIGGLGKQIGLSTAQASGDIAKTAAGQVGITVPAEEKKDIGKLLGQDIF